jgi:hypothetical protein
MTDPNRNYKLRNNCLTLISSLSNLKLLLLLLLLRQVPGIVSWQPKAVAVRMDYLHQRLEHHRDTLR